MASTSARGYGHAHQQTRARWQERIDAGGVTCARCGGAIPPGTPWDLGHTEDRSSYNGPEHVRCNRSAGGRKGNRARVTRANPTSRAW